VVPYVITYGTNMNHVRTLLAKIMEGRKRVRLVLAQFQSNRVSPINKSSLVHEASFLVETMGRRVSCCGSESVPG
jgi:hypothetical protein